MRKEIVSAPDEGEFYATVLPPQNLYARFLSQRRYANRIAGASGETIGAAPAVEGLMTFHPLNYHSENFRTPSATAPKIKNLSCHKPGTERGRPQNWLCAGLKQPRKPRRPSVTDSVAKNWKEK